eukprot:scaffold1406_cov182-Ochromonas_danica.AAC.3
MSVIWQLPRDILHSVYSEWLGWKDVSRLDVACVGKSDREVWLTSLTDLRIFHTFDINRVSDGLARLFYVWLKSRRVFCVEDFPVSVNVLEDLMGGGLDMESYCPSLRSITIRRWYGFKSNPDVDEVKVNMSVFLSHCHSLQGVTITLNYDDDSYFNVVLEVLVEKLRENSLIKIALRHSLKAHESKMLLATLLAKNASSLRDLHVNAMGMDLLFSTLIKNQIRLRVLDVYIAGDLSHQTTTSLISYLSSAIHTNNESKSVYIWVKGSNDDWAVSLSHALRRRQYKQVTLKLREDYYHPVGNLKSLLEPYEIHLIVFTSNNFLISILQDLPHLNSLCLSRLAGKHCTDATLAAITQHAKSLTELIMVFDYVDLSSDGFRFSDKLMSDLIETCQLLESLRMPCYGLESLVSVSKHSSLRCVELTMTESVPEEMLDGLLLDEKVTWPCRLEKAIVRLRGSYYYEFNQSISGHWSKQRL